MMIPSHVDSHYAAQAEAWPLRAPVFGQISCDVCIIGGGLAGLTCADELARAGKNVVLLEAQRVGWGASGRNGGFVSPGFAADWSDVLKRVDLDHAKKLYALSVEGFQHVETVLRDANRLDVIQGHGGLALRRSGTLAEAQDVAQQQRDMLDAARDVISGDELKRLVNSDRYVAGILKPDAYHIDPLAYANILAARAEEAGAQLFEQTRAMRVERRSDLWEIITDGGRIVAGHVVMAGSAYGMPFAPLRRAVVPVSTYVMVSQKAPDLLANAITFRGTISDNRRAGDYYRLVGNGADTRLLWGGRITTRRSEPRKLAQTLLSDITTIYPQLAELKVERAWSGWMGYARHKMPLIGPLWPKSAPNMWALTAFGGHGLNTTAMGGRIVARSIADGSQEHRLFAPWKPVTIGGPFGQAAVQASYFAMQIQDAFAEWRSQADRLGAKS